MFEIGELQAVLLQIDAVHPAANRAHPLQRSRQRDGDESRIHHSPGHIRQQGRVEHVVDGEMIVTSTSDLRSRRASRRAHSNPVNPLPTTTTDVTMSL